MSFFLYMVWENFLILFFTCTWPVSGVLWFMGSQRVGHDWATELNWTDQFPQDRILKTLSFPHCILTFLAVDGFITSAWVYLSFLTVPLASLSFLCQHCSVLITVALQYSLKSESMIPSSLFSFLKISWAIQGVLWFHINLRIISTTSGKNVKYFDWDCIESLDCFG